MLLASWHTCNIRMWLRQHLFTYWKNSNIPIIKKQSPRTDGYYRLWWIFFTLFRMSICCYFNSIWICQQFFTHWKYNKIPNIKKNLRTDRYDWLRWIFLTLFRMSICCYLNSVCMLSYEEKKSGSNVNELRYIMFTKKNLSGDGLPSTLDALVLHLYRALIFFH